MKNFGRVGHGRSLALASQGLFGFHEPVGPGPYFLVGDCLVA